MSVAFLVLALKADREGAKDAMEDARKGREDLGVFSAFAMRFRSSARARWRSQQANRGMIRTREKRHKSAAVKSVNHQGRQEHQGGSGGRGLDRETNGVSEEA
jgi:hypothetical protein